MPAAAGSRCAAVRDGRWPPGCSRARSTAVAAWQVAPSVPGGDEPHYLIITQSLLKDGDLRIENNHRAATTARTSPATCQAGLPPPRAQRRDLFDPRAGPAGARRARRSRIAGYHGRRGLPDPAGVGRAARWRGTSRGWSRGDADAAWFGWAAVTLSASGVFHSFTVYPGRPRRRDRADRRLGAPARTSGRRETRHRADRSVVAARRGAGAAAVAAHAVRAHRRQPRRAGPAAAVARRATPPAKAVAFLAVPAISAIALDRVLHRDLRHARSVGAVRERGGVGVVHPRAAWRDCSSISASGCSPTRRCWSCAFAGLAVMVRRRATRRLGLELLFVLRPVSARRDALRDVVGRHGARRRGSSCRCCRCWRSRPPRRGPRCATARRARRRSAALVVTAFVSCALVFVDGGRLAFNDARGLRRLARMAEQRDRSGPRGCRRGGAAAKTRCSATSRSGCARSPRRGAPCAPRERTRAGCAARGALCGRDRAVPTPSPRCARSRSSGRSQAPAARQPDARPARRCCGVSAPSAASLTFELPALRASAARTRAADAADRAAVLRRRSGGAGAERSAALSGAFGPGRTLSACGPRGRAAHGLADDRHRAGSVLAAQRAAGRAAGADRARLPGGRPRASSCAATSRRGGPFAA